MLHMQCGGPITWPPRSLDLNLMDFFFWGQLKSLVHETVWIVIALDDIVSTPDLFERGRQSFIHRCRL
ncbi:hypothetical protein TNCV_1013671 [Trichonephila clavipes]|uniref:Uncharacterized protein n=1 Tax=Trichonephila clavipes TaxID=2585209 RepID=A0A8X7B9V6_TRICX|nr:hypothetical protein TNCV_1013671 [Trichonephila clavipes]